MYKLIIWVAGSSYSRYFNLIRLQEMLGHIKVIAVTDHISVCRMRAGSQIDGYPFLPENEAFALDFDYCLAETTDTINALTKSLGISRQKLIQLRVLAVPYFDFSKYVALRKSSLSIISPLCWGEAAHISLICPFCLQL